MLPLRDMPRSKQVRDLLHRVAGLLGGDVCWLYQRRFHFRLAQDGWTLAVSPDSAGRTRIEACHWTRPVATLWIFHDDDARLAAVVQELAAHGGARVGV